jgi:hypothetical protein
MQHACMRYSLESVREGLGSRPCDARCVAGRILRPALRHALLPGSPYGRGSRLAPRARILSGGAWHAAAGLPAAICCCVREYLRMHAAASGGGGGGEAVLW